MVPRSHNGLSDIFAGETVIVDKQLCKIIAQRFRVLIFSQTSFVLDILEDYCVSRRCNRIAAIDNYSHEGSIISLLTPRVGALGLNLATAGIVVMIATGNPKLTYRLWAELISHLPVHRGRLDRGSSQSPDLLHAQMDPLRITQKSPSFPPSPSEASILAAFNHVAAAH
ncbi:hypothetical protein BKA70DRAFT_1220473 [Coprinopsis sp. MPI-PUGE-AT-0042]|nr:hypothetical protein BKA70DRAFT_1220473 [Coprinopsis sp. MPI-PUGE-AT-0042]